MAEVKEVAVPDIGDFTDVPVIEILVAPGQDISPEDPLVVLESDKATMEVPAPFGGTVEEILVEAGDRVSEGTPILKLSVDGAAGEEDPRREPGDAEADAGTRREAGAREAVDTAIDAETESEATEAPKPEPAPEREPETEEAAPRAAEGAAAPEPATAAARDGAPYASPSVRRLARERRVDLSTVAGTGRKGRITVDDVEQAAAGAPAAAAGAPAAGAAEAGLGLAPWPKVDFEKYGPVERVPLSRIQKISGPNLARNWVRIPHVTHHDEADITELEAFRKQVNAEQQDVKVTMVALLLKASVTSLKAYPQLNSSLAGDELVLKRYYHLGFAADTPQGLMVPVIRDVDQKGLLQIAGELTELSGKARAGKIGPADIGGSTFSISSLGGIGGTGFTPIVNAPEVAILGVTRSATKPVWNGSEFMPRLMLPLSLSYDHRVVDGALAARFVAHLVGVLSDMRRVLL